MIPSLFHILTKPCAYRRGRVMSRELVEECRRIRRSSPVSSRYSGRNKPASYFINAYIYMTNTVFNRWLCLRYVSLLRISFCIIWRRTNWNVRVLVISHSPLKRVPTGKKMASLLRLKWHWNWRFIVPTIYRERNSTKMHFWSKFDYSSLNGWQVIERTTQNGAKFNFQVECDLESQSRSSLQIIGILTKVFCTSVPNLVILSCTAD